MASAHGAGLMVLPAVLPSAPAPVVHAATTSPSLDHDHSGHAAHLQAMLNKEATAGGAEAREGRVPASVALVATLVHSAAYLVVTGLLALVVYSWAGLRLLRSAWINLDLIWTFALIVTAVATPFV
jgi:hypothetical protein